MNNSEFFLIIASFLHVGDTEIENTPDNLSEKLTTKTKLIQNPSNAGSTTSTTGTKYYVRNASSKYLLNSLRFLL